MIPKFWGMTDNIVTRGRLDREDEFEFPSFMSHTDSWWLRSHLWIDRAHVIMLAEQSIVQAETAIDILDALDELEESGMEGPFGMKTPHTVIESRLIDRLDESTAGQLHTARSRNDKTSAAMRIGFRRDILDLLTKLCEFRRVLLERSRETSDWLIPCYTHLQTAQPTTLGHYFVSHERALARDSERLFDCYERMNRNPLGAAACTGTGFDIDRQRTTELLGFDRPLRNSIDSVSSRDFAVELTAVVANTMVDVSRLCQDLIIWNTVEFDFVDFDDRHTGTSSIMPQKKNPDTAEGSRAMTGGVIAAVPAALSTLKGVPMSESMDLTAVAEHGRRAINVTGGCVWMLTDTVDRAEFDSERMAQAASRGFTTATELADTLVRETDIAFRTAHHIVATVARATVNQETTVSPTIVEEAFQSVTGRDIDLDRNAIKEALEPAHNVDIRDSYGGPGEIETALDDVTSDLEADKNRITEMADALDDSRAMITDARSSLSEPL